MISAVNSNALMLGYKNPNSHTQAYNCHKLDVYNVGAQISNNKNFETTFNLLLVDNYETMIENIRFYAETLKQAKNDKTDLNYWLNYVVQFGIEDKIPHYQHIDYVASYNLDVVAVSVIGALIGFILFRWFKYFYYPSDQK